MVSPLEPQLDAALGDLVRVDDLLVALDFDGTLAPEVDVPEDARALPEAREAILSLLGLPRTRVALVSGRALASLEQVTSLPATALLVGSHGIEFRLDTPDARVSLNDDEVDRVRRLRALLQEIADAVDGAWVEVKPAGFALHTRLSTDSDAKKAQAVALQRMEEELPGLTVRRGKNLVEFSVRAATKGDSLEQLRQYIDADAVFFAGDDVTDEDGFAMLRAQDLGLKCGSGTTAAKFRVADPGEVAAVLQELFVRRQAHLATS